MLSTMSIRRLTLDLTIPKVGMLVKTVRPLYSDNGLGGHELPPGLLGQVSEVLDGDEICVSITFDEVQPNKELTRLVEEWAQEYNNESLNYTFNPGTGWECNQIRCAGLLEFHLYCDLLED